MGVALITPLIKMEVKNGKISLIFAILEKLGEIRAPQALQVVSDHEPVGLRMELGMRGARRR